MSTPTEEQMRDITDAILQGRKIEAIKTYREATGKGLKESKLEIESITRSLAGTHPGLVPAPAKGCAPVLLAGLVLIGTVAASRSDATPARAQAPAPAPAQAQAQAQASPVSASS